VSVLSVLVLAAVVVLLPMSRPRPLCLYALTKSIDGYIASILVRLQTKLLTHAEPRPQAQPAHSTATAPGPDGGGHDASRSRQYLPAEPEEVKSKTKV